MNEHEPPFHQEPERNPETAAEVTDAEHETTIEERIETGISAAMEAHREINLETAMHIAKALARAAGEDSTLARFANTGVGSYLALREEYLDLYGDPNTPPEIKRWIDWFGTFLVRREGSGSERTFTNEHADPQLDRVLVRTDLPMNGAEQRAHVPATLSAKEIIALAARLDALEEYQESAFRAFLTLPDVNAADPNLIESYRESYVASYQYIEEAVRELAELDGLEADLRIVTGDHGLPEDAVTIDYEIVEARVREAYDIVSEGWHVHAFTK